MSIYARIQSGVVAELFTPPSGYTITDCFAPGLVWVDCTTTTGVAAGWTYNGSTFHAPVPVTPPAPTLAAQAQTLLNGGLAITCTSDSTVNGIYTVSDSAVARITSIQTGINAGKGLPFGASTIGWVDAAGAPHLLTAAIFTEIGAAMRDFVYACDMVILGASATLPSASVTIP
jgi:hypothetical protein